MHSLDEVRKLLRLGEYRVALDRIEEMEKQGTTAPGLLVLKAMCIQLRPGPEEQKYGLRDVENALETALQIDSECVEALIEAAQYWFYVEDDAKKALPLFQKAFEISKAQITEVVAGISNCLCEVATPKEAISYLELVRSQVVDEEAIQAMQEEIKFSNPD